MNPHEYLTALAAGGRDGPVSADVIRQFSVMAKRLSAADSPEHIFECSLSETRPTGDYSFKLPREAAPALLADMRTGALFDWAERDPGWASARRFIKVWLESEALRRGIGDFWFEFDYEALAREIPSPCLFFDAAAISAHSGRDWIFPAVEALSGTPLIEEHREALLQCIRALPEGVPLFQLGAMHGRTGGDAAVRLFTGNLRTDDILPYLREAGWQGNSGPLESFFYWAAPYTGDHYIVDFDVCANGVSSKLGINIGVEANNLSGWLAQLETRQLADSARLSTIREWLREYPSLAPLLPGVSHMKIPCDGALLGAKIYLHHKEPPELLQNVGRW